MHLPKQHLELDFRGARVRSRSIAAQQQPMTVIPGYLVFFERAQKLLDVNSWTR